ncbi:MAG: alanine dehydrogenase [Cyclobacteriaceae bacterium]|nr:alanine dehydrogenase [Cyclobacteriaceae bacterium]
MVKIGLIREGKIPVDKRVPLTPEQASRVKQIYGSEVVAQSSTVRCFSNDDYLAAGIPIGDSVSDCDIILGVKEVPLDDLIENKTYFFFSHTIKKQAYNRKLLQELVKKNIRMVDYETLTNKDGQRIVAFGRWAGIVGAYNGILTFGRRFNFYNLKPANQCHDLEELKTELSKVDLPNIKIVLTGGGRVAQGAMEILDAAGIRKVSAKDILKSRFDEAVYAQLNMNDYNLTLDGSSNFVINEFHKQPERFKGDFLKYTKVADLLIAGAYWDPKAPVLFTRADAQNPDFNIKVIADITCDIEGSIPSTLRASTIDQPHYDYSPIEGVEKPAFSSENNITVMAVDNLPCELPRDASNAFGEQLIDNVLPHLLGDDKEGVIERATICKNGKLTEHYSYLQDFLDGK